jgi:alpha-glucosidase (family GH31 glycosyl hydrolase)
MLVDTHLELKPFFLSIGSRCYAKHISPMYPLAEYTDFTPSTWNFIMGDDILVAPVTDNGTQVSISFPEGNDWLDWWTNATYAGGSTVDYQVPLNQFAAFQRKGKMRRLI